MVRRRALLPVVAVALVAAATAGAVDPPAAVQLDEVGEVVRLRAVVKGSAVALVLPEGVAAPDRITAGANVVPRAPGGRYVLPQGGTWRVVADVRAPRGDDGRVPDPRVLTWAVQGCDGPHGPCAPAAGGTLELRDLGGAGATTTVDGPGAAVVPFTLRSVGPGAPAWALAATSALGPATPDRAALEAGPAGLHDVTVTVDVPAGAAPGLHAVELVATYGAHTRRAVGQIRVTEPPTARDVLAVTARRSLRVDFVGLDRARPDRFGRVELGDLFCLKRASACGHVVVALVEGRSVLARTRVVLPRDARRRAVLRLGPRTLARLRRGTAIRATAVVRSAPGAKALRHGVTLTGA